MMSEKEFNRRKLNELMNCKRKSRTSRCYLDLIYLIYLLLDGCKIICSDTGYYLERKYYEGVRW